MGDPVRRQERSRRLAHLGVAVISLFVVASALFSVFRRKEKSQELPRSFIPPPSWSRKILRDRPPADPKDIVGDSRLSLEQREAILRLFNANLPGPELVRRLYEITGEDAYPFLMPLILDRRLPDPVTGNMLAHLLAAARCGGMQAYVLNVADGVYDFVGKVRDPRFREPLLSIACDGRYGAGLRSAALSGLNEIGLDDVDKAAVISAVDLREPAYLQSTSLFIARQFSGGLTADQKADLERRAIAVALTTQDGDAKADALGLLNELGADVTQYGFMNTYAQESNPETRRQILQGVAKSMEAIDADTTALVEIYFLEPDPKIRQQALLYIAGRPATPFDVGTLAWLMGEIPSTASADPDTTVLLVGCVAQAAASNPEVAQLAMDFLTSIADGKQYSEEVKQEARTQLTELGHRVKEPPR